jgi:hypothetical protein
MNKIPYVCFMSFQRFMSSKQETLVPSGEVQHTDDMRGVLRCKSIMQYSGVQTMSPSFSVRSAQGNRYRAP